MSALGNLVVSLSLDYAEFTKGIDKSSYQAQRFAQKLDKDVNRALKQSGDYLKGVAGTAAGAVAAFLAVDSAVSKLAATIEKLDVIGEAAEKLGIAVEQLSALEYAAKLSGASAESLATAIKILSKNAVEAASGTREQVEAFAAVGVSAVDANGKIKATDVLLGDLAEGFSQLSDGAVKTALAQKVFGKSGAELIPFLNNGRDGLAALTAEAEKFGVVISGSTSKAAAQFNDNLDKLRAIGDGVAKSLATALLPALNEYTEKAITAFKVTGSLTGVLQIFLNEAVNAGDPAKRVRDLADELERANKTLAAYKNSNLRGTIFESSAQATADAVRAQLEYNRQLQLKEIDAINAPPPNSAAARQRQENEAREKKEADERAARMLRESEARKKAEEELKRLAKVYADYTESIAAKTAAAELEVKFFGSAELPMRKLEAQLYADLKKAKNGSAAVTDKEREAIERLLEVEQQRIDLAGQRAAANFIADEVDKIDQRRRAIDGELEQIAIERESIGKTAEQIAALTYRRELDAIAVLEEERNIKAKLPGMEAVIEALDKEIAKRKELADARRDLVVERGAAEVAAKESEAYKAFFSDVSRGLTDALFRGFEGGKSALKNFRDTLKNAFKTLALKVAIQPVLGSLVGGAVSGLGLSPGIAKAAYEAFGLKADGAGGASSGLMDKLSSLSSLKDLGNLVTNGFSAISGSVTNGIVRLGDYLATSSNNTLASIGDYIGSSATTSSGGVAGAAGGFAAGAAGIAGGYALNRMLAGGYKVGGVTGNLASNGAAIGAVVGSIVPGIGTAIGAVIGGALGGLVNGLFGKKVVAGASGIEGTIGRGGFDGRTFQDITVKRRFRSDQNYTNYGSISSEADAQLDKMFGGVFDAVAGFGKALNRDVTGAVEAFTLSGRFAVANADQLKESVNRVGDAMIRNVLPAVESFRREGERLLDTAARLVAAVKNANQVAVAVGARGRFDYDNAGAAVAFGENVSQNALNNLGAYLQNFGSPADAAAANLENLNAEIRLLGLEGKVSADTTREAFAGMVKALDVTTDAGQRELNRLLLVAPALAAVVSQREAEAQVIAERAIAVLQERAELEAEIFDLTATAAEKLELQRLALDESNRAIFDQIQAIKAKQAADEAAAAAAEQAAAAALERARAVAEQRAGLEDQLFQLTATNAEMLARQRGALDESNRALFDQIEAVKAKQAAEQAAAEAARIEAEAQAARVAQIMSERAALEEQLFALTATNADMLARQRAALDESNRALFDQIEAVKAKQAADEAAKIAAEQAAEAERQRQIARNELDAFLTRTLSAVAGLAGPFDSAIEAVIAAQTAIASAASPADRLVAERQLAEAINARYQAEQNFLNQFTAQYTQLTTTIAAGRADIAGRIAGVTGAPVGLPAGSASAIAGALSPLSGFSDLTTDAQAFAEKARDAVDGLLSMRDATIRYLDAQKQLADQMNESAAGLRATIDQIRFDNLSQFSQFDELRGRFQQTFAQAQNASGEELARLGGSLNSQIAPLLNLARELFASSETFQTLQTDVLASAEAIASKLEQSAPQNLAQRSVDLLSQIDASLADVAGAIEISQRVIAESLAASTDRTLDGLRAIAAGVAGDPVPGFASGGMFAGGVRLVGERGPELEVTGPARIFNASETANMLRGGSNSDAALLAEIRALRQAIQNGDQTLNVQIVTPDGREISEQTIKAIRERSRRGELVIYSDGVK